MPAVRIDLTQLVRHLDVAPGGEIVLRGSFESARDGSILDAATMTWPKNVPGGDAIDAGGLVDFEAGGLHLVARDPISHEVRAVATGDPAAACAASGVEAPCLVLRVLPEARSRLMTVPEWTSSLKGAITVEVLAPPALAPVEQAATKNAGLLGALAAACVCVAAAAIAIRRKKRFASSPAGQLLDLARRVKEKVARADAVVAAPIAPALEQALRAVRDKRVDAGSKEGKRVADVLLRVDRRLDEAEARAKAHQEQEAADELVAEMEAALEAAEEIQRAPSPR